MKEEKKMGVFKESQPRARRRKESIGLLAIGSSGMWEIAIDQTTSGPKRWFAQIEGPSVYLYFEVPSLETVRQAIRFLAELPDEAGRNIAPAAACDSAFVLGGNKSTRINLVRDDECDDRYFLVLEAINGPLVRFTVTGEDLTHLTEALRQARDDIDDDE